MALIDSILAALIAGVIPKNNPVKTETYVANKIDLVVKIGVRLIKLPASTAMP